MARLKLTKTAFAIGLYLAAAQTSEARTISLNFNSLPSAQGWTYYTTDTNIQESRIFSLNKGVLTINSLGTGSGYFYYGMPDVIDPSLPFTVAIQARVLSEDGDFSRNLGAFGIWSETGTELFNTNISSGVIQDQLENVVSSTIDNTKFHYYLMEVSPGVGSRLFVDGLLIGESGVFNYVDNNQISFGDGVRVKGTHAEIKSFVFRQSETISPTSIQKAWVTPTTVKKGQFVTINAQISGDPTKIGEVSFELNNTKLATLTDPEGDGLWTARYKVIQKPAHYSNVKIFVKNTSGIVIDSWPGFTVTN